MKKYEIAITAIVLAVCLSSMYEKATHDAPIDPEIVVAYSKWVQQHGKLYATPQESHYRLTVFAESFNTIKKHQEKADRSYELGLTKFADMTDEEFGNTYGTPYTEETLKTLKKNSEKNLENYQPIKSVGQVPTKVDWREKGAIPPVRAQNPACARSEGAYTAAAAATAALKISQMSKQTSTDQQSPLTLFSVQRFLDCYYDGYICGHAYESNEAFKLLVVNSVTPAEYPSPYSGIPGSTCETAQGRNLLFKTFKQTGQTDADQEAITRQTVTQNFSLWPADFKLYTGGVYTASQCSSGKAKQFYNPIIVGFNRSPSSESVGGNLKQQPVAKPYWITQWAFGTGWGENGYLRLEKINGDSSFGACGLFITSQHIIPY